MRDCLKMINLFFLLSLFSSISATPPSMMLHTINKKVPEHNKQIAVIQTTIIPKPKTVVCGIRDDDCMHRCVLRKRLTNALHVKCERVRSSTVVCEYNDHTCMKKCQLHRRLMGTDTVKCQKRPKGETL